MSVNQVKQGVPQYNRFYPCPAAVTSGMPVLIGSQAAVAMDAYDPSIGGTTFLLDGDFTLTVIGQSASSPVTNAAIGIGDKIYAAGTLDVATNVTYNLTLDKNANNSYFGTLQGPAIGSGVTSTTAVVRLKIAG
jgi:hypothetical protein